MKRNLEIVMAVPGMKLFPGVFEKQSVGGSETAGYQMARALARRGHFVYLFCNIDQPAEDDVGVRFFPLTMFLEHATNVPHDITIVQRLPELLARRTESKLNVLWMHDLPLGRQGPTVRGAIWNVDGMFVLSEFHKERYKKVYGLKDETLWLTRNGLDLTKVDAAPAAKRERSIFYAARPERGLENLVSMLPEIIKRVPDVQLKLCTYANDADELAGYYRKINRMLARHDANVEMLGNLTKEKLYEEMKKARVYAYPVPAPEHPMNHFAEVSCIAAMEAQACGLPIVATKHGALPETIHKNAGILIDGLPWEEKTRQEFIDNICSVLTNDEQMEFMSNAGASHGATLGWDPLAEQWESRFIHAILQRNDFGTETGARRLARHFWRQSDIFAMKKLAERSVNDLNLSGVVGEIGELYKPFAFIESAKATAEQYAKIGDTHDARVFPQIKNEPRFDVLARWVTGHRKEIVSVLDYGCGLGGYAFYLSQITGVKVDAIDIDPETIRLARQEAGKLDPDHKVKVSFNVGTHDKLPDFLLDEQVDAATIQEVLEHVLDPRAVVQAVEKKVRKDGFVYITVPYGPWEYSSYHTYPHRCHVHTFDKHDIRDLFGKKKDLTIHAITLARSPELDNALGWWVISYRADHEPLGEIDWERKLWLQRPRQTLSVTVMAGGEKVEETLHWMMKPLRDIADEIIIADSGLTDEAKRMLANYPVKIVPSVDPKTEGFETPRNHALDQARMDWVLWIDTDECLLNPAHVDKYLRANELNGYGVQQHHFAIDTRWAPDLPVRLFRNRTGVRFYGMIHEHPEQELNKGPGMSVVAGDIDIAHVGYLHESVRRDRFNRNWPMLQADQKRYPTRDLQKHFIIRDSMLLVQNALEKTRGVLSDAMKAELEKVIVLYREHFLDKAVYSKNLDVIEYYSTAVGMLGRGFEVVFAIEAAKEQVQGKTEPVRVRFDTEDDCLRFTAARIKAKIQPFTSPDF